MPKISQPFQGSLYACDSLQIPRLIKILIWCFLYLLLLNACSPKLKNYEPPVEQPENFSYSGSEVVSEEWWKEFNDPKLNTLIDSALANNLNLATTWEQFQEAKAIRKRQSTFLLPDIEAQSRAAMSRPEPDFAGGENVQLGVSAAYELDLWGRIRASVQAEDFRMQASYFDYKAAAISLSAEIASTWYELVTATEQLQLVEEQIKTNEDIMKLIRARFGAGTIRAVDILRQEQLLKSTQDLRIIYETDVATLQNQLAILVGKPPQNFSETALDSLPQISQLPETGLPLELVRNRPDVQRQYALLMAADRDMAEAVRNKFPRLSLNLTAQVRSNNFQNLFNEWAYTLAGNLVAPLIYWGRLRAEVDRTEAVKNQQLYQYGQSVLTAFQEVEDALIREQKQKQRIEILAERLELAQKTNKQLQIEFINGLSEYLDVLLSLDQQQQLQRNMLQRKREKVQIRIDLYRALAGGFDTGRSPPVE